MRQFKGNLLLVSNFPSDTAYAWWLMEHFWKTQAELLKDAGWKTYLAYPKITNLSEAVRNAPIETIELNIPWHSKVEKKNCLNFIESNNICYIYFTDQPYLNLQYVSMRFKGIKRIIVHDHTPGDRPPIGGLKGLLKATFNTLPWITADKVFCVSELMRQRNMANSRIPKQKCAVVQNGIQPILCSQECNFELKQSLGLKPSSFIVITSGRAHPYKRFDFVIECAEELHNLAPELDITFLLVGSGPAMPELKKLVQSKSLQKTVHLLGFRNDIHNLLCSSDIALHAALGEGFSLSIIEYMSAALAVLVPNIPSVSQAITHDETGIIYPQNDPLAVATHIKALATNNDLKNRIAQAAKNRADTLYNLEQCTQSLITEVSQALRNR